jgi:hypothetical protein
MKGAKTKDRLAVFEEAKDNAMGTEKAVRVLADGLSTQSVTLRQSIEDEIERLIALLDSTDGDGDLEHDDLDPPGFIWGGGEAGGPAQSGT